jgi:hypothetical protein
MAKAIRVGVVLLVLLTGLVTTGCSFGSSTSNCTNNECEVTLDGVDTTTSVDVGVTEVDVKLKEVTADKATVSVGGVDVDLAQGASASAGPYQVTCKKIQGEKVTLAISN